MERLILVVAGEDDARQTLLEMLSDAGRPAEGAASGADALARLRQGGVALLIVGPQVQGMHGLDLVVAARAEAQGAGIPILALLAPGAPEQQARARFAGATGWVKSPPDPVTLHKAVTSLLG